MQKIALITGATRGLGRATARRLVEHGLTVIVGARDAAAGAHVAHELGAESVVLDVDDTASVRSAAAEIAQRHGRLDVLVNNAGILPEATADRPLDAERFARTIETNLLGAVRTSEHFLPLLQRSREGAIVNVSSTMGSLADQSDTHSPYRDLAVPGYRASTAALNSLTIELAKLLAGTPIRVNAVCPGWVRTDLAPGNREHAPLSAEDAAELVVRYALLGPDGPTGGFFAAEERVVAW